MLTKVPQEHTNTHDHKRIHYTKIQTKTQKYTDILVPEKKSASWQLVAGGGRELIPQRNGKMSRQLSFLGCRRRFELSLSMKHMKTQKTNIPFFRLKKWRMRKTSPPLPATPSITLPSSGTWWTTILDRLAYHMSRSCKEYGTQHQHNTISIMYIIVYMTMYII